MRQREQGFQVYVTYHDTPNGAMRWLAIGDTEMNRLTATLQLQQAGKHHVTVRNGRPQGPVRLRRNCYGR